MIQLTYGAEPMTSTMSATSLKRRIMKRRFPPISWTWITLTKALFLLSVTVWADGKFNLLFCVLSNIFINATRMSHRHYFSFFYNLKISRLSNLSKFSCYEKTTYCVFQWSDSQLCRRSHRFHRHHIALMKRKFTVLKANEKNRIWNPCAAQWLIKIRETGLVWTQATSLCGVAFFAAGKADVPIDHWSGERIGQVADITTNLYELFQYNRCKSTESSNQ